MREMRASMDAAEVTDWAAYERVVGPLDVDTRADYLAAMLAERITVMQTAKKSERRKIKLGDFLPRWGGRPHHTSGRNNAGGGGQTPGQQKNLLKALTRRFGGTIKGSGHDDR